LLPPDEQLNELAFEESAERPVVKNLKGFIPNYFSQLTLDQLVNNTLTGYLICLLGRDNLDIETILKLTKPRYPDFRKPSGKPYTACSERRSIKSALSANGLFS
jgi:hypothetical protein